jgi:hypothetical protein
MRGFAAVGWGLGCVLATAGTGNALEKRIERCDPYSADDWSAASTCLVSYYNICTGWVWIFGFDSPTVQLGVHASANVETWNLTQSRIRYWSGSPCGRGFTGTIAVYTADANGCPAGPPLESQAFCPPYVPGGNAFYTQNWSGTLALPNSFVLAVTYPGYETCCGINPLGFGADFGTTGPTGPDACGTCFPSPRESRSYLWQDAGGTYCPGQTFREQDCEVELLWDLTLSCTVPVDDSTWGSIKTLYR